MSPALDTAVSRSRADELKRDVCIGVGIGLSVCVDNKRYPCTNIV